MLVCELSLLSIQAKDSDQLLKDLERIAPDLGQFAEVLKKNYVTATALPRLNAEQLQTAGIPELAAISIAAYHDNVAGVSWHPTVQRVGSSNQTPNLSERHSSKVTYPELGDCIVCHWRQIWEERQISYISD